MSSITTLIFVIGAWHTETHISPILQYFPLDKYKVVPVVLRTTLPFNPPPTIHDNITHLTNIIEEELGSTFNRIAILGHSVSGQTVAAATSKVLEGAWKDSAREKIVRLLFTACFWDPVRSLDGVNWYTIDPSTYWASVTPEMSYKVFYNTMAKEEAKPFVEALRHNMAQMPPQEGYGAGWKTIPGTYFVCTEDNAVKPEMQRLEAKEQSLDVVDLDMDHCPMVSKPSEFAKVIRAVLEV